MKQLFTRFGKIVLFGLLTFSLLSPTSYANAETKQYDKGEKSDSVTISTCSSEEKIDENNITGAERKKIINKALKNDRIHKAIKVMDKEGYKLDKDNIVVKRVDSDSDSSQTNVVLTVLKSNEEYRLLEYNNLGDTRIIDVKDGEANFNYTLPGEAHAELVYCIACATVCVGLIEAPPAFASCVALCSVACS